MKDPFRHLWLQLGLYWYWTRIWWHHNWPGVLSCVFIFALVPLVLLALGLV